METKKICNKCGIEKNIEDFYKRKDTKDSYRKNCKTCQINYTNNYQKINLEKVKINHRVWSSKNKNKIKTYWDKYYDKDKEAKRKKKFREENIEAARKREGEYYILNKDKIKISNEKSRNKETCKLKRKKYNLEYVKKRKIVDPLFKLKSTIRTSIIHSLKRYNYTKKSRTYKIIGVSYEFLLTYIEKQFSLPNNLDGNGNVWMNWSNHGKYNGELNYGWDIDHIIPLSSAKSEEELLILFKYNNLQPLCSKINRDIKKDIIDF
jgi:hypothetical protein